MRAHAEERFLSALTFINLINASGGFFSSFFLSLSLFFSSSFFFFLSQLSMRLSAQTQTSVTEGGWNQTSHLRLCLSGTLVPFSSHTRFVNEYILHVNANHCGERDRGSILWRSTNQVRFSWTDSHTQISPLSKQQGGTPLWLDYFSMSSPRSVIQQRAHYASRSYSFMTHIWLCSSTVIRETACGNCATREGDPSTEVELLLLKLLFFTEADKEIVTRDRLINQKQSDVSCLVVYLDTMWPQYTWLWQGGGGGRLTTAMTNGHFKYHVSSKACKKKEYTGTNREKKKLSSWNYNI